MARAGTPDSPPAVSSLTNAPASPNPVPTADSIPASRSELPYEIPPDFTLGERLLTWHIVACSPDNH